MPPDLFAALFAAVVMMAAPPPERVVLSPFDGGPAVYEGVYRRDPAVGWTFVILKDLRPGVQQGPAWSVSVAALKPLWNPSVPWPDEAVPEFVAETRGKMLRPLDDAGIRRARASTSGPLPLDLGIRVPLPTWKVFRAWRQAARERAPAPDPVYGAVTDAALAEARERARVRGALPPAR